MNRLIGYVGEKELANMLEKDIKALDVINIAFGHVVSGRVVWEHPECCDAIERIRTIHPELKLVLSIGGWGAGGFSDAASTLEGRETFAKDCVALVKEYGLDGVDLDWEYPCMDFAGIDARPKDKENFTLLLQGIRKAFEQEASGRYLLTIAAGGDSYYLKNTQMAEVAACLDYVQLMTYDLRGSFQVLTGHHTSLFADQTDLFDPCVEKAVQAFHEAGVPRDKIVIGAAFYSREWEGVPDRNHGLIQHAKGPVPGHPFHVLTADFINKNGFTRYWDDEAKAPWLFNGERFISYDDEDSLSYKITWLKEQKLCGIMFWVYEDDGTHTLVSHMRRELDKESL